VTDVVALLVLGLAFVVLAGLVWLCAAVRS
jgi:hypothetical protein